MLLKVRMFLLKLLINGGPVAFNLHLKQGLHLDMDKTKSAILYNVNINGGDYGVKVD